MSQIKALRYIHSSKMGTRACAPVAVVLLRAHFNSFDDNDKTFALLSFPHSRMT